MDKNPFFAHPVDWADPLDVYRTHSRILGAQQTTVKVWELYVVDFLLSLILPIDLYGMPNGESTAVQWDGVAVLISRQTCVVGST